MDFSDEVRVTFQRDHTFVKYKDWMIKWNYVQTINLNIHSKVLHKAEEGAIERNEELRYGLGIEMTG